MRCRHKRTLPIALCGAFLLSGTTGVQSANDLRSFYTRTWVEGGDDIISVESVGQDVRVRLIRVANADETCPGLLVRAIERTLPRTTVQAVAGVRICSMSNRRVERAMEEAPSSRYGSIDFFGSADFVVASCGTAEKRFVFRQPPIVDRSALRRSDRDVDSLWNVVDRIRSLVTGQPGRSSQSFDDPFEAGTSDTRTAQEALGTSLLPELVSGKFAAAFGGERCRNDKEQKETVCDPNYLAWLLRRYAGPPAQRGPLPAELIGRESLGLLKYDAPRLPPIAVRARVFGDVRLRITADPRTGFVTNVEAVAGSPLHVKSAIDAARTWQFAPESSPADPIEVTLRFQLQCPAS
jgi:hypothetical protein